MHPEATAAAGGGDAGAGLQGACKAPAKWSDLGLASQNKLLQEPGLGQTPPPHPAFLMDS